jgi:hypothetical protein
MSVWQQKRELCSLTFGGKEGASESERARETEGEKEREREGQRERERGREREREPELERAREEREGQRGIHRHTVNHVSVSPGLFAARVLALSRSIWAKHRFGLLGHEDVDG